MKLPIALTALLPLFVSCGQHEAHDGAHAHDAAAESSEPATAPAPSDLASVHAVRCGCDLEAVGVCGEYIEVEDRFVELDLPVDMGPMPFCGRDGLKAKVDGELEGEVFVATTFAYAD